MFNTSIVHESVFSGSGAVQHTDEQAALHYIGNEEGIRERGNARWAIILISDCQNAEVNETKKKLSSEEIAYNY